MTFTKDVGGAAAGDPSEATGLSSTDVIVPIDKTALATSSGAPPTAAAAAAAHGTASGSFPTDAPSPAAERPPSRPEFPFEVPNEEFFEFAKAMWGERAEAAKEAWASRASKLDKIAKVAEEARAKREAAFVERFNAAEEAAASDISRTEDGLSYVVRYAFGSEDFSARCIC